MQYQRQIIAYHGCLRPTFEDALLHGKHPSPSDQPYDWLGRGIYFWEYGPDRALEWARLKARRASKPASEARVLGAILQLGVCIDLLDTKWTRRLRQAHELLRESWGATTPFPENRLPAQSSGEPQLRYLDCAVINAAAKFYANETGVTPQTIRGAFWEGDPAYPGSGIYEKSHVQICVRDTSCIIGYFRVGGDAA